MKLIAKVTLVTGAGEVPPGGEVEIKSKAEADSLVARGFAELPSPVEPDHQKEPAGEGEGA